MYSFSTVDRSILLKRRKEEMTSWILGPKTTISVKEAHFFYWASHTYQVGKIGKKTV